MKKVLNFKFEELHPAFAGFLIDNTADFNELTASIVDLIQRGYIEYNKNFLKLIKIDDKLLLFEIEIIERIFNDKNDNTEISLNSKLDFNSISPFIKLDCVRNGLAEFKSRNKDEPLNFNFIKNKNNSKKIIISLFIILLIFLTSIINIYNNTTNLYFLIFNIFSFFTLIGFLFIAFIMIYFFSSIIYKKNTLIFSLTEKGLAEKEKYLEIQNYLKKNYTNKDLNLSRHFLPYLVTFELNELWFEHLRKINIKSDIMLNKNNIYKFIYYD